MEQGGLVSVGVAAVVLMSGGCRVVVFFDAEPSLLLYSTSLASISFSSLSRGISASLKTFSIAAMALQSSILSIVPVVFFCAGAFVSPSAILGLLACAVGESSIALLHFSWACYFLVGGVIGGGIVCD